jgi:hypothetical protein
MKQLLIDAMNEIHSLRRHNEILNAQLGIVEVFAAALGMKKNEGGMTSDVAWQISKKIEELDEQERQKPKK